MSELLRGFVRARRPHYEEANCEGVDLHHRMRARRPHYGKAKLRLHHSSFGFRH
jgi:hypothetical protein